MLLPPRLKIQLRRHVTLTFDLLTPKVDHFVPSPDATHVHLQQNRFILFSKYPVHEIVNT